MDYIYSIIKDIEMNPLLYLNDKSLLLMKTFLDGYTMCRFEVIGEEWSPFLRGFQQYVAEYYKDLSSYGWWKMIDDNCLPSEQPIEVFFALVERYVYENPLYRHD